MKSILISLVVLIATTASALDKKTITVNGAKREYLQYVPRGIGKNAALLISCHGMNQDANYQSGMLKIENPSPKCIYDSKNVSMPALSPIYQGMKIRA